MHFLVTASHWLSELQKGVVVMYSTVTIKVHFQAMSMWTDPHPPPPQYELDKQSIVPPTVISPMANKCLPGLKVAAEIRCLNLYFYMYVGKSGPKMTINMQLPWSSASVTCVNWWRWDLQILVSYSNWLIPQGQSCATLATNIPKIMTA